VVIEFDSDDLDLNVGDEYELEKAVEEFLEE